MVDLAMSIFEFLTKFLVFWHPWHPWVCIRSDFETTVKQIWAIPPTVRTMSNIFIENMVGKMNSKARLLGDITYFQTIILQEA